MVAGGCDALESERPWPASGAKSPAPGGRACDGRKTYLLVEHNLEACDLPSQTENVLGHVPPKDPAQLLLGLGAQVLNGGPFL